MPVTHVPKYPVVDPDPTLIKSLSNLNMCDYLKVAAFATTGFMVGLIGARKPLRTFNSRLLGSMGLFGGLAYANLGSTQRLAGLEPNEYEVTKYGALSSEELAVRMQRVNNPNLELVESVKKEN